MMCTGRVSYRGSAGLDHVLRVTTMISVAFSTLSCPDWSWSDLLKFGPQHGYDGVELRLLEREADLLSLSEFQVTQRKVRLRELQNAGFQVCGLGSSVRFDYPDARQRVEQIDIGRAYVDLAAALEAGFVRVFGDVLGGEHDRRPPGDIMGCIADGLQRLGEYAEDQGLQIVIETHGDYSDTAIVRKTLDQVECTNVGVLWDTHHPWKFQGEALQESWNRLQGLVRHTHWKDSFSLENDQDPSQLTAAAEQAHALMSGHRHADYVLFGAGQFPAVECMRLLKQSGYQGWYSLEWEKMWHPELEPPEVALPLFPPKIRWLWETC